MSSPIPAEDIRSPWPNLPTMFFEQADRLGDRTALRRKRDGRWIDTSWSAWARDARRFAGGLLKLGLNPKDVVSIIADNRPEWVVADLGTLAAGCVLVPVYVTLPPADVHYILEHAETRVMVVENAAQLAKVLQVRDRLPHLKTIVLIDGPVPAEEGVVAFDALLAMGDATSRDDLKPRYIPLSHDDVATLIYTSGTTGPPKGAMITHGNILWVLAAAKAVSFVDESDESLSFLPLCHAAERIGGLFGSISVGATINFATSVDALLDEMAEVKPTVLLSVPRMLEKAHGRLTAKLDKAGLVERTLFTWAGNLGRQTAAYRRGGKAMPAYLDVQQRAADRLIYEKVRRRFGGRLRFIVSAGAPLSKDIADFFYSMNVLILEGYGMTELSAPSHINLPSAFKLGSVGMALPGVKEKIAPDGEILVKAPSVFVGYWKRPADSMEALEDGWMHTGDIGHVDAEGFLYITDRKKDLIITSGGKNVAPQNIENKLKAQPGISQVMVYGDRRKYLTALVTVDREYVDARRKDAGKPPLGERPGEDAEARDLVDRAVRTVNLELASFETVKQYKILDGDFTIDSGELTPTLKLKRKVITERYGDVLSGMYPKE